MLSYLYSLQASRLFPRDTILRRFVTFLCFPLSLLFFLFVVLGIELRASHTFRPIPVHQAAPTECTSFLQLSVGSLFSLLCWSGSTGSLQHSTDSRGKQEQWALRPSAGQSLATTHVFQGNRTLLSRVLFVSRFYPS